MGTPGADGTPGRTGDSGPQGPKVRFNGCMYVPGWDEIAVEKKVVSTCPTKSCLQARDRFLVTAWCGINDGT